MYYEGKAFFDSLPCIFAANNTGPGTITVEFRRDSGTWQSDGDGFYFHDAGTDDGYHID